MPTTSDSERSRSPTLRLQQERAKAFGAQRLTRLRGLELLRDPYLNKGTAFSARERDMLGLAGLLPPQEFTLSEQLQRQKRAFDECTSNIAKYTQLENLHNRNETLYYRFLLENVKLTMPIVYTPTVGQACLDFSELYRARGRGLFFSRKTQNSFRDMVRNWPQHDVDIIVITDGSRILGLGDLGINGMGIPIGKLALYVAAAGFVPWRTLPITMDLGTNNEGLRGDPNYIGMKEGRPEDKEFYEVMKEAIEAIKWRWPKALIQFEDFSNEHAFGLLNEYKDKMLCFNDDIQGTASVILAGIFGALRIQKAGSDGKKPEETSRLRDQRIVFLGAGSAGVGVADLIAEAMAIEAAETNEFPPDAKELSVDYYRKKNFWLMDSKGLVTATRGDKLQGHKIPFAREDRSGREINNILDTVKEIKPTLLIGLAGLAGGSFTKEMVEVMDKDCTGEGLRPIVMALSNPTSKAECTAKEAYEWTEGRAIFVSGSPFDEVEVGGKRHVPGQGNNMYIFPGVGYGAVSCGSSRVTNEMFYVAAKALSAQVCPDKDLKNGSVYPDLAKIRDLSAEIGAVVCRNAVTNKLNTLEEPPEGWKDSLRRNMWWPEYEEYV